MSDRVDSDRGATRVPAHPPLIHHATLADLDPRQSILPQDAFQLISECAGEVNGLEQTTALQVVAPIISALAHMHALGYAHRDVKSENILLAYTPQQTATGGRASPVITDVRLIDFDSCCETELGEGPLVERHGSMGFMAPGIVGWLDGIDTRMPAALQTGERRPTAPPPPSASLSPCRGRDEASISPEQA